jgi:CO/xanthine dehydrogenase FAD-binding subunit
VALLAAGPTPIRATAAEQALVGARVDEVVAGQVAALAVSGINPTGDLHGSTEYRRALMEEMVRRALVEATRNGSDER